MLTESVALAIEKVMPDWLAVIITAILPFIELRGAIPLAIGIFDMPWYTAFVLSVIGNLLPIPFILLLLPPVERVLRRWTLFDRLFIWVYKRTRARTDEKIKRFEAIGLTLFVAIPLPVTGAWTGSLAALIFDIPFKRAMTCITIGVIIAGTIVTSVYTLGSALWFESKYLFLVTVLFVGILYLTFKLYSRSQSKQKRD